jgi:hypothetical protein
VQDALQPDRTQQRAEENAAATVSQHEQVRSLCRREQYLSGVPGRRLDLQQHRDRIGAGHLVDHALNHRAGVGDEVLRRRGPSSGVGRGRSTPTTPVLGDVHCGDDVDARPASNRVRNGELKGRLRSRGSVHPHHNSA